MRPNTAIRLLTAGTARGIAAFVLATVLALLVPGVTRAPIAAASAPGAMAGANAATPDLAAVDRYVEGERRATRLPGLALGIVRGDQIVHLRGFGHADSSGRAVTPQMPFIIGSTTKSFTALAVMQLVEAGKIDLDAPVQRYLPWFRVADPDPASARITVRNLLTHTSGLHDPLASFTRSDTSAGALEQAVRALRTEHLGEPTGRIFQYANINYSTLGLIVQVVAGQPYEDYLRAHVLAPLEMTDAYLSPLEARRHGLATGHRYWFGHPVAFQMPYNRAALPAGFISASAEAMTHYLIVQLNGGRYHTARVLSAAGIATLHRPAVATGIGSISYAMGWYVGEINGVSMVWHPGSSGTFRSNLTLAPAPAGGWGIVMLANGDNVMAPMRIAGIARGVLGLLVGRHLTAEPTTSGNQIIFYALLAAVVVQLLGIARSTQLLRRWNAYPARRPRGRVRATARIVLPLLANLAWALVCLVGLPLFMAGSLSAVLLLFPDMGVVLLASGAIAAAWGIARAALAIGALRRPASDHSIPPTPQINTVSV